MAIARMKKTDIEMTFMRESQNSTSPYASTPSMLRERKITQKMMIQAHCGTVSVQYMTTSEMALYSLVRTVSQRYQYAQPRANARAGS